MIRPRRLCILRYSAAARKTKRTSTATDEASAPSVTLANSKAPDRCPAPDERAAYVCCVLRVRCCICPAAAGYRLVPSTGSAGAWQLMRCRAECVPRRRRHMPPLRRSPRVRFGSQARGAAAPSKLSAVQTGRRDVRCRTEADAPGGHAASQHRPCGRPVDSESAVGSALLPPGALRCRTQRREGSIRRGRRCRRPNLLGRSTHKRGGALEAAVGTAPKQHAAAAAAAGARVRRSAVSEGRGRKGLMLQLACRCGAW